MLCTSIFNFSFLLFNKVNFCFSCTCYMSCTLKRSHYMKSVQIQRFFWFVFSRIRTKYGVSLRIQSEYRNTRTRKTPYLDTFHAVNGIVNSEHFGVIKTIQLIYNNYWSTSVKEDLTKFISTCQICLSIKTPSKPCGKIGRRK